MFWVSSTDAKPRPILLLWDLQRKLGGGGTHSWTRGCPAVPRGIPAHVASWPVWKAEKKELGGMLGAIVVLSPSYHYHAGAQLSWGG